MLGALLQPVDRAADVPTLRPELLSDGRVVHHIAVRGAVDAARGQLQAHEADWSGLWRPLAFVRHGLLWLRRR